MGKKDDRYEKGIGIKGLLWRIWRCREGKRCRGEGDLEKFERKDCWGEKGIWWRFRRFRSEGSERK